MSAAPDTADTAPPACGKITYDSRKFAQAAMRATLRRPGAKHRPGLKPSTYFCRACGAWHWGRKT